MGRDGSQNLPVDAAPSPAAGPAGRRRALALGAGDALGAPVVVLSASFFGFGSLVSASDLSLALALYSTLTGWALPGQVAAVEMTAAGAGLLVVGLAVALANARLLPLVVTLVPRLAAPDVPRWQLYLAAHLIAVTTWIFTLRRAPTLTPAQRLSYLVGFAGTLWTCSLAATAAGYLAAGALPAAVSLGLVFLNPVYFLLLLLEEAGRPSRIAALVAGGCLGPLLHLVSADWGLLAAGLIAGTAAFAIERRSAPADGGRGA